MSAFEDLLDQIQSRKCQTCYGHGEYDDAEIGDILCQVFKCTACKGTGFKDGQAYQATPISSDPLCGRGSGVLLQGMAVPKVSVSLRSNPRSQRKTPR